MFRYIIILCWFFPIFIHPSVYTVKKGESLWVIANRHQISMTSLLKINDLSKNTLYVGQKIFVPNQIIDYKVKSGDSYEEIAKQFNTKVKYIVTLNNISEPQPLEGQILKVPTSEDRPSSTIEEVKSVPTTATTTAPEFYSVRRGDTLSDVALKYNTTVPKLRQLNNKNSNSIYVGEKLIVGNKIIPTTPSSSGTKITYKVKKNDTLGDIAITYGVSQKNIREWNNKRSSTVYVGENLTIYSTKATPKSSSNTDNSFRNIAYTVRRGDNLSLIAGKYKVRSKDILAWNNKKSSRIYAGETLRIRIPKKSNEGNPAPKLDRMKLSVYKVKRGDTLDQIAINHGVTRSKMLEWNNKRNTRIYIGERLKIYSPQITTTQQRSTPKSKKAVYETNNKDIGIRSVGFKNIPLPIKASTILKTVPSGRGVDIQLRSEEIILSPTDAKITYAGYINALQNVIILELPQNRAIVYAGLNSLTVTAGQTVAQGQKLGKVGTAPNHGKPTLYLELRENNKVASALHAYKELKKKR